MNNKIKTDDDNLIRFFGSNQHYISSSQSHFLIRTWMSQGSLDFKPDQFVLPVFVISDDEAIEPIALMPNVNRYGRVKAIQFLEPLVNQLSLKSVLLFPVLKVKDLTKATDSDFNPVLRLIPELKKNFPNLYVIVDVCLCGFTQNGHCGIFDDSSKIDLETSLKYLSELSLAYASAGADMVAPSDMMDSRIGRIRNILNSNNYRNVAIMSYSAKFSSCLYGPFREAANSAPTFGDRKSYQLTPGSTGLAVRAVDRDICEGADIVMVKPGLFYLDILSKVKSCFPNIPRAVYNTSGEYSMIYQASREGIIDLEAAVFELMTAFKRAGAQIIITYFTPFILERLKENK